MAQVRFHVVNTNFELSSFSRQEQILHLSAAVSEANICRQLPIKSPDGSRVHPASLESLKCFHKYLDPFVKEEDRY